MKTDIVLFRNDLRIYDNPTLKHGLDNADEIIPVYIFDDYMFEDGRYGVDKTGSKRLKFIYESVVDLRDSIEDIGGQLYVKKGDTINILENIIKDYGVKNIHFQEKPAIDEINMEREIRDNLNVNSRIYWTHTLYHKNDLPTQYSDIDDTFTPWRKEVQYQANIRDTIDKPSKIKTPDLDQNKLEDIILEDMCEERKDKGISFEGGENSGIKRLNEYIWDNDRLRKYKKTRNNLLGKDYSSKFSPWLAQGCISPRHIYAEVQKYEEERVSNDSTYWMVFELMWRDFFQFQFMKHGSSFFDISGIREVEKNWIRDEEILESWQNGATGIPFVDANMRQLNKTGYMSNRGRQNVASFLVDVLNIDWRLGAAYFEKKLIDYDVCSNWGNWAYIAGVGNDSREDRYFNVVKQSKEYDPNGEFIRKWIPELDGLPANATHKPWLLTEGQQSLYNTILGDNYPEPIVDIENKKYSHLVENK